ncbi:hypothetical protein PV646_28645 [Streptomyces sp. ID05-26A]|nr:hypothetical protein [Streptomyces sp. ID05-26A]
MYLADAYDAKCKADDLLKQLANAENLTVEQHRAAANDLLACAQMIATRDSADHAEYRTTAQTLAALAVAHSAVAGIPQPAPAWPTTEPAPTPAAPPTSRVQFNRDGYQA